MTLKSFIRGFIPAGVLELYKRRKKPAFASLNPSKYKGYKPAGGYGDKLTPYVQYVKNGTTLKVKNVFEIGANFAQDADFLMECFDLRPENVYVFEAHPEIFKAIKKIHSFNAYNNAVYNAEKEIIFNIFPLDYKDTGWSSIHGEEDPERLHVKVQAVRMDNFMKENGIEKIDFLKIDVEGCTYQVLEGFGNRLADVNCIQIEAEHGTANFPADWGLYEDIEEILKANKFELVEFHRNDGMKPSDSFWVQTSCIKYT